MTKIQIISNLMNEQEVQEHAIDIRDMEWVKGTVPQLAAIASIPLQL